MNRYPIRDEAIERVKALGHKYLVGNEKREIITSSNVKKTLENIIKLGLRKGEIWETEKYDRETKIEPLIDLDEKGLQEVKKAFRKILEGGKK